MAKLDPKVKNLIVFLVTRGLGSVVAVIVFVKLFSITDYVRLFGQIVLAIAAWRGGLSIYRRLILPAKKPLEFGKWAIVTGSTSGIGKEFADYLAKLGMSVLIISRSEDKLKEQKQEISGYGGKVEYIAYDFTKMGDEKKEFYARLDKQLQVMHNDGGVGLLINNVGIANEIPKAIEEFTDEDLEDMINCNIYSTMWMTRAVLKYMKEKKNGCVVSISSGSGNNIAPYLVVYSATKAFITQFTRSMKIECWGSGVDFLVVTPFYVVSNLFKRKSGTIIAPMPIKLVEGTLAQLGKKFIWQGHGYWFHGFIGILGNYYWGAAERNLKMMMTNRKRYDERQASKKSD